ncbi:recombinase family protein [Micromonospora sp. STR1s_6]|uniref:Recombinase family protein n=1 Tax=Micromonospora tarensis TaxID=2806100 RepID=A0ABS1YHT4_9ACTN|nr:recombinase family protein [Micromonospora tarensis]MBM0276994.1 recombinase family protein [Micromonospora tarensis]
MTAPQPKPFAFYGRVSTEDNQDPESSRSWQLSRATTLIQPHGGQITAEYFDIGQSRSLPWQRRPHASRLLAALRDPRRGFSAVVVGEPHRACYGNQFGLTVPLFAHYGVELWVPEIGGPIDPDNEAHELVMSVFGGMSKGERNRIKLRVRTAMAAQTLLEGRYLGGPPPYGYTLQDLGPHPNPRRQPTANTYADSPPTRGPPRSSARSSASSSPAAACTPSPKHSPATTCPAPPHTTGPVTPPQRHRLVQERRPRHPHQPPLHRPAGLEQPAH